MIEQTYEPRTMVQKTNAELEKYFRRTSVLRSRTLLSRTLQPVEKTKPVYLDSRMIYI